MTRSELYDELYKLVKDNRKVQTIFDLFAKLSPEQAHANIFDKKKAMVPSYDPAIVQRKEKLKFSAEQKAAARGVLRELGLI